MPISKVKNGIDDIIAKITLTGNSARHFASILKAYKSRYEEIAARHNELLNIVTDFIVLIHGKHTANDTIAEVVVFERNLVKGGFVKEGE